MSVLELLLCLAPLPKDSVRGVDAEAAECAGAGREFDLSAVKVGAGARHELMRGGATGRGCQCARANTGPASAEGCTAVGGPAESWKRSRAVLGDLGHERWFRRWAFRSWMACLKHVCLCVRSSVDHPDTCVHTQQSTLSRRLDFRGDWVACDHLCGKGGPCLSNGAI